MRLSLRVVCGILALQLVVLWASPTQASVIIVGPVVSPINGHAYYVLSRSTWWEGEATAVMLGGHLATVRSLAENDWLMATFGAYAETPEGFWLGLNDAANEGTFVWTSGELVSFLNWYPGEPNNLGDEDYVHLCGPLHPRASYWNDIDGDYPGGIASIAEVSAVPEPASLLLLGTGLVGLRARKKRRA